MGRGGPSILAPRVYDISPDTDDGIAIALLAGMTTTSSTSMLQWIFTRNGAALTCELDATAGGYEVCVVPHWNVASAAIERFDAAVTALERHAELARYLRDTGWHLARRGTGRQLRAA
jgi:hypothetical protein